MDSAVGCAPDADTHTVARLLAFWRWSCRPRTFLVGDLASVAGPAESATRFAQEAKAWHCASGAASP